MKCLLAFLFCLAAAQMSNGQPTDDQRSPHLLSCYTREQQSVEEECFVQAKKMAGKSYAQSMSDCIDATEVTEEGSSVKQTCMDRFKKQSLIYIVDCLFSNIGEKNIATDPIDLESFKAATINVSNLDDAEKSAALADFDACLVTNYSLPYPFFSYKKDEIPAMYQEYIKLLNEQFGQLAPTSAVWTYNCLQSALLLNGCGTTSEETVAELIQILFPKDDSMDRKTMQCLNVDFHWYQEICHTLVWSALAPQWEQDCTRGTNQTEEQINDSCRIKRMKQYLEFTADCAMQKHKAISASYFFKLYNKKDPQLYKETIIGGSNVSDEQKEAALAYYDTCMDETLTSPYKIVPFDFKFDPDVHPELVFFKELIDFFNRMFSIGDARPTELMRAIDCTSAALSLNGCDDKTPKETFTKLFEDMKRFDKFLDVLNMF